MLSNGETRAADVLVGGARPTIIIGQTPTGRTTITTLRLNNALIVAARALWTGMGVHPPHDE